jgi:hypothetical protein
MSVPSSFNLLFTIRPGWGGGGEFHAIVRHLGRDSLILKSTSKSDLPTKLPPPLSVSAVSWIALFTKTTFCVGTEKVDNEYSTAFHIKNNANGITSVLSHVPAM